MKIHPWTVNDPAEMQALIDRGVDGIITDDPATLEGLLATD
jgi:glycerophosphoryl diester phosphodiesterase